MYDNPIGIIDSGLGGLSIFSSIADLIPNESTIYIADQAFVPYGNKSQGMIRKRILRILSYLARRGVKLVVVACNTATVAGIDWYRAKFPGLPIIGVVPVIKTAAAISSSKTFAVLSTTFTTNSRYQEDLIGKFAADCRVYTISAGQFVTLVEAGNTRGTYANKVITRVLDRLNNTGADVIVLGSTHFAFLKEAIRAIVGEGVAVLDSGGAVARQVRRVLDARNEFSTKTVPTHSFYTTGNMKRVSRVAGKLLGKPITFSYAKL